MVTNNPNPGGPAVMQGLEAARPTGPGPVDDTNRLMQAGGTILEDAVRRYGPEIIQVLEQMLTGPGPEVGVGMNTPPPVDFPPDL